MNTLRLPAQGPSVTFYVSAATGVDRVRYLAVHEFGHVLGFQHEDDSPQRAPGCSTQPVWDGVTQIGAWDRNSIMNSGCNPYGNGLGYLSAGDIAGVRQLYGTRRVINHGDFNGDATVELGVWRPATGTWYVPGQTTKAWGQRGDVAVPGDYNGDGKTDRAVWRPSTGVWYVDDWVTPPVTWGEPGDVPVPGDYDGDGRTNRAVWRPSTGVWYRDGNVTPAVTWGQPGDVPVPGDYDGDGRTDMAVWRPSTGDWYINLDNGRYNVRWGQQGDVPVPGDYVGEGKVRPAVWRPSTGQWFFQKQPILYSGAVVLGQQGDIAVVGSLSGNGIAEVGVWRPSIGTFFLPGGFTRAWGQLGDVPLPKGLN